MEGLPSQVARRVRGLICKRNFNCCCPAVVGKIWRDKLPQAVRLAVSSHDLKTQWDGAMDHADIVYYAQKADVKEVAAVKVDEKTPDKTAPELQFDINDRQTWGRYHSDFKRKPPKQICFQHYRWGKQAHFCRKLGECPWENYTAPHSK